MFCMELNEKEVKYLVDLLEHRNYRINDAIQKVLRDPQYIDDVQELNKEFDLVLGIIDKLTG